MSFAAGNLASGLVGYFCEKEYGRPFEYKMNYMRELAMATHGHDLPHMVFCGPGGDQVRMALVKKTFAYVAVDEDENGLVIEKWYIKRHVLYEK